MVDVPPIQPPASVPPTPVNASKWYTSPTVLIAAATALSGFLTALGDIPEVKENPKVMSWVAGISGALILVLRYLPMVRR